MENFHPKTHKHVHTNLDVYHHDITEYLNTTLQLLRVLGGRKNMNIVGQHHIQFF